jgi:anti-anti-sigma regulatory factor
MALRLLLNPVQDETNPEGTKMTAPAYCFTTLKTETDQKPEEVTICSNGKITAESAERFQREIRDHSVPAPSGQGFVVPSRIVLDLSNVTHIDNAGFEALLGVWTNSQKKACRVEVINRGDRTAKRGSVSLLERAFRKMMGLVA